MCHDRMGETHMLLEQVDYAIGKEIEVDRSYTFTPGVRKPGLDKRYEVEPSSQQTIKKFPITCLERSSPPLAEKRSYPYSPGLTPMEP